MLSKDFVKKLKNDGDFQEFLSYLIEIISELDTIEGFDDKLDNEALGEQVRARIIAKNKIYDVLKPFVDFSEKQPPTDDQVNEVKVRYGL